MQCDCRGMKKGTEPRLQPPLPTDTQTGSRHQRGGEGRAEAALSAGSSPKCGLHEHEARSPPAAVPF